MPATHLDSAILGMGGGAPVPATTPMRNEALLKAGALQGAILNSANFALIATDEKGIIQLFNIGAERMLGYAAAEVVNQISPAHISDPQEVIARAVVLSREFATAIAPGFEALVFKAARAIEDIYEFTYLRKNGTRLPVILSVTTLRAAEKIIGYLLIGTDNSARLDVEDRLRWTEESFHLMVESVIDYAIVMLDQQGRVMSWNSGAQRIKGYSAEEIVGQSFTRFYALKDAERGAPSRDLEAARTRGRFEDEGWRMRRDGSTFWANIVLTAVLDHAGNLRGFAQLTRDLTGRRQAEDEIAKAKAVAEKTSLASAEFLSGMSHELRTSLNAILGFAQLMESEQQPPPTPSQKESVAKIVQAGWYLMELINEVMDLAMIESGRLSWSLEPMSLADVMHECHAAIEPQAQKSGIRMTLPEIDGQCFIKADRTRVKQVLTNLLSNAIKYNRPGGSVVVECSVSAPQRVRISVTDTGAGIGLVVTKRLVELMGGAIGVRSHVGKGSVFWIELVTAAAPRLTAGDEARIPLTGPVIRPGAAPRTLLYVEDNPANLQLVEQIIARRPDMRLLSARNGPLGIALARSARPDVILMDINLPGMSGIKAMQMLRAETVTAHIPVVALSANAIPRDIERGLEAGFFRYLTKPIKVAEFMDTLDVALKHAEQDTAHVRITP